MPPMVARSAVETFGAKNKPCFANIRLRSLKIMPGSTVIVRSSGLNSNTRVMKRLKSITTPLVKDCPLVPVPPPRAQKYN